MLNGKQHYAVIKTVVRDGNCFLILNKCEKPVWWPMPIISATRDTEAEGLQIQGQRHNLARPVSK